MPSDPVSLSRGSVGDSHSLENIHVDAPVDMLPGETPSRPGDESAQCGIIPGPLSIECIKQHDNALNQETILEGHQIHDNMEDEDDVEELSPRCELFGLRYPADDSGYAAPAIGYQECLDDYKEMGVRSREKLKQDRMESRKRRLAQGLPAEDPRRRQLRKERRAKYQAMKVARGEELSETDTSLSEDEFGSAPWVFEERKVPPPDADEREREDTQLPAKSARATEEFSEYGLEKQATIVTLSGEVLTISPPNPENFVTLSESARRKREKRRAKGVATPPPCSPSPPCSIIYGSTPDLQPTVEPDETEATSTTQAKKNTQGGVSTPLLWPTERVIELAPKEEGKESDIEEIPRTEEPTYATGLSPKWMEESDVTETEYQSRRGRKSPTEVTMDDEAIYEEFHGPGIRVAAIDPNEPSVITISEYDRREREERRRMGIPTSPPYSSSVQSSEESSSDGFTFTPRERRPIHSKCARARSYKYTSIPRRAERSLASDRDEFWKNEEETMRPGDEANYHARAKRRRASHVKRAKNDVNIKIDLCLNIDPELRTTLDPGNQRSGLRSRSALHSRKTSLDTSKPESFGAPNAAWYNIGLENKAIMAGLVGLAVGFTAGIVFRRHR
ncbi:hypothetical protein MaudMau93_000782 [Microsporum audouinii]